MSTTKIIFAPELTGVTGLVLFLRDEAGTLINGGGDNLTESPLGSGRFIATVPETISQTLNAVVRTSGGVAVREGWLQTTTDLIIPNYPTASGGSNGSGDFSITITVRDQSTNAPIAGALVTVLLSGAQVAWGVTRVNGQVPFALNANSYTLNASVTGFQNAVGQALNVTASGTATITLTAQSLAPPPSGQFASIALVCLRGAAAVPNAVVTVELEDQASTITGGAQMKMVGTFVANSLGAGTLVLPWSSSFKYGDGIFTVTIKDPLDGQIFHTRRITVPDVSTANYYELPSPL